MPYQLNQFIGMFLSFSIAGILLRSGHTRTQRGLFAFMVFAGLRTALLITVRTEVYVYAPIYWGLYLVQWGFIAYAIFDAFCDVTIFPSTLPRELMQHIALIGVMGVTLAGVLFLLPSESPSELVSVARSVTRSMTVLMVIACLVTLGLAHRLNSGASRLTFCTLYGFLLVGSVSTIALLSTPESFGPLYKTAGRLSTSAFLLSQLVWLCGALKPPTDYPLPTIEQLAAALKLMKDSTDRLARSYTATSCDCSEHHSGVC